MPDALPETALAPRLTIDTRWSKRCNAGHYYSRLASSTRSSQPLDRSRSTTAISTRRLRLTGTPTSRLRRSAASDAAATQSLVTRRLMVVSFGLMHSV